MMTSAYLAILRPIDLKSTLTNAWGELKDAKSKEDFEKAGKKAWSGVKSWFNQKAREQPSDADHSQRKRRECKCSESK